MSYFNPSQVIASLLIFFVLLGTSCSKFSAREMYTGGDTNFGSDTPGPNDGPPGPNCGSVTVAWSKNTEADLAGYRIYYGLSRSSISTQVQITDLKRDSFQIKDLTKNLTYYFQMTAYDLSGNESVRTDVASKKIEKCAVVN